MQKLDFPKAGPSKLWPSKPWTFPRLSKSKQKAEAKTKAKAEGPRAQEHIGVIAQVRESAMA